VPSPVQAIDARRLPLRVPPVEGESFPSFVARLAADLGITMAEALAATGVIDRAHSSELPYFASFTLPPRRIDAFARNARLPRASVESMFVKRFSGVLGSHDFPTRAGQAPLMQARRLGVIVRSSNLCPDCIVEDQGAWQVSWMLVWSFACERHRRLLADVCPSCGSFLGFGAHSSLGLLGFPSLIPEPGRCGNSVREGMGPSGRAARPCGHSLPSIETHSLEAGSPLLAAQARLAGVLDGDRQVIDGDELHANEYLVELRSVATLLLWTRSTEHYRDMPGPIAAAMEEDFAGPLNNRRWLRDLGTRPGRVLRAAGVLTRAVSLLNAPPSSTLAERLEPILRQAEHAGSYRRYPSELRMRLPPSRLVDAALQICEAPTFRSTWRTTTALLASARGASNPLRVDQIPQLFWPDLYESLFKGLVREIRDDPVRRFCSLTLVKIAGELSWREARVHLGLEGRGTHGQIGWVRGVLRELGNTDIFLHRMGLVLNAVTRSQERVDYAERRYQLRDLFSRPEDEWRAICTEAGIWPASQERRRRNVAAWLWCHLTIGDYRRSPAFRDGFTNYDQNSFVKFRNDVAPLVSPQLHRLAERILVERGLPLSMESWRQGISDIAGAQSGVLAAAG